MKLGLVGVGKMGGGILRRLRLAGHEVVATDQAPQAESVVTAAGASYTAGLEPLLSALPRPRIIWLMVPAAAVPEIVKQLALKLDSADIVIDGGNSFFKDSLAHARKLDKRGIHFIDAGVSGGLSGEHAGYALMVGGEPAPIASLQDIFTALAAPEAYLHVGPVGAGHYTKMVHNAIEYGMMQALGEGFDLLKNGPFPEIALAAIARVWSQGTIIRSYLLELTAHALAREPDLQSIAAYVEDSGEGRWSVTTAVEHGIPFTVNTAALFARFQSRQSDQFAYKLIAALRKEFGGHAVKPPV